jgi:hypothetical protein
VRELELRNENKLDPTDPKNHNHNEEEKKFAIVMRFVNSQAHTRVCEFLVALSEAVTDRTISSVQLPSDEKKKKPAAAADTKASAASTPSASTATATASAEPSTFVLRTPKPPAPASIASPAVCGLVSLLQSIDALIDATPPLPTASRFGNVAFRDFCDKLKAQASTLIEPLLQTTKVTADAKVHSLFSPVDSSVWTWLTICLVRCNKHTLCCSGVV